MSAYLDIIILLFVVVMVFAKLKNLLGTGRKTKPKSARKAPPKFLTS